LPTEIRSLSCCQKAHKNFLQYLYYNIDGDILHLTFLGRGVTTVDGNKRKTKNWQDVRNTKGINGKKKPLTDYLEMIKPVIFAM
jgi:hypothetical protein